MSPLNKTSNPLPNGDAEAIAQKRLERQKKKEEKERLKKEALEKDAGLESDADLGFIKRRWLQLPTDPKEDGGSKEEVGGRKIAIVTWNMLAQGLVRRTLFPGSDLLKWKDRGRALHNQIQHFMKEQVDIFCLQEVDSNPTQFEPLTKLLSQQPTATSPSYSYTFFKSHPAKQHGLMIAWRSDIFENMDKRELKLDELTFDPSPESGTVGEHRKRTALSRVTRSGALLLALKLKDAGGEAGGKRRGGLIVATHHLYWHGKFSYERCRQTGLVVREIGKFRDDLVMGRMLEGVENWPCFMAGDFNTQPSEATYRFLTGYPLSARQERELKRSMVIHESVDKLNRLGEATPKDENQVPGSTGSKEEGEDEDIADGEEGEEGEGEPAVLVDEEGHASRVMKGVREAKREDGLLTVPELISLFSLESSSSTRTSASEPTRPAWKSAYGLSHGVFENERTKWFGERRGGMWMVPMKDLEVQPEGTGQDPQAEATGTGENARAPTKKQEEAAKATTRERAVADPRVKAVPVPLEDEEEEAEELKGKTWDEKSLAGYYEPMWTNFTPLWRCTLDYLFYIDPRNRNVEGPDHIETCDTFPPVRVQALLETHSGSRLEPGLPRKGVEPSDHIALGCTFTI